MAIGGSGTQADPWTIGSSADLVAFAGSTSYWASGTYAKLTADIDMTGVSTTSIGDDSTEYRGNFDGVGYVISNLTISASSSNYQGLFGCIYGGTIQNIGCEWFDITGGGNVGGLVGNAYSASVSNCYAYDCTVSGSIDVGGLFGSASASVSNCYAYDCTVSGSYYVGGLVGYAFSASVSNCAIYGGTHGGTLVGSGSATITNCYTSNDVSSAVFHNRDFWDNNAGGSLSQTYLSWDFATPVWYWDATANLPVLQQVATAPAIRTKVSGTWKDVDKTLVKVNGTWCKVSKVFTKVNGTWKEV